jgi:hypothetical protein
VGRKWVIRAICLLVAILSLLYCVSISFAYFSPLQDVTVWKLDGNRYRYKVYDPRLERWMVDSFLSNTQPIVDEGIVAGSGSYSVVVYDPGKASWIHATFPNSLDSGTYSIKDGLVGCNTVMWCHFGIYDPSLGHWRYKIFANNFFYIYASRAGVGVSFKVGNYNAIELVIYDPQRSTWADYVEWLDYMTWVDNGIINIDDVGTVTWSIRGIQYRHGYNPATGQWYDGPTLPMASFVAQPSLSKGMVFFTDMSIGGTSWHYDFGDGTSSSERAPTHTYAQEGVYTVVQTVTGSGTNDTTTRTVTINKSAALPFLLLLLD